ncbi:MAG: benzoyl-CoA reductase subunit D, partial [Acidobacteria bacterium]|nr:benzoyl-CoA reductase subunit D [Candidatus Sulfomarinibacter sp. MAG AM2]
MTITAGIDVGSGAVKAVVMECEGDTQRILFSTASRIRRRDIRAVVDEVFSSAARGAEVKTIDYVATTGEGEDAPFATGHFYGMTTHARGGLFLEPEARAVLDVGALHSRAVLMNGQGKVLSYKMTSQCASGSGQFLENIARYLGVSQAEIGELSLAADDPEKVSSICAVLAETDVINMVSRGISTENILRGIHESMALRFARLLRSIGASGVVLVTGGLASDAGLVAAIQDALDEDERFAGTLRVAGHPLSIFAGAIGAAIWGA